MSQTKAQLLDNIKDNVQLDARNSLRFADTDSSHYVAFKAPATVSSNVTWTLPAADGSANYVLATDGSGTLSWIADPAGQWTTSGSNIYFTGGNVGIGDSSPSNPLSVTGASSFDGDLTLTGSSYNVVWDKSDNALEFADNAKAVFGAGSDLEVYHNGTHSFIQHTYGSGNFFIESAGHLSFKVATNETAILANANGAVEFYYDNVKKFETDPNGVLQGDNTWHYWGDSDDLYMGHNGTHSYIVNTTGNLNIRTGSTLLIDNAAGDETYIKATENGAVELYHNNNKKLETSTYGTTLTGNLFLADSSDGNWGRIKVGTGEDLQIYHSGSHSFISNTTGTLQLENAGNITITKGGTENMARFIADGAVELYYDNVKTFATEDNGAYIYGPEGGIAQLMLYADEGDDNADKWRMATSTSASQFTLYNFNDGAWETSFKAVGSGGVELYYDNSLKLYTNSSGVRVDDNTEIQIGSGGDMILRHNGTNSFIESYTGNLILRPKLNEDGVVIRQDGAVELYNNNAKKFNTQSGGVQFYGSLYADDSNKIELGDDQDLEIYHDGSHSYVIDNGTGDLKLRGSEAVKIEDTSSGKPMITCTKNFGTEIYHQMSSAGATAEKKFETTTTGATFSNTSLITFAGDDNRYIDFEGNGNNRTVMLRSRDGGASDAFAKFTANGAVELYYDNYKAYTTNGSGGPSNGMLSTDAVLNLNTSQDGTGSDYFIRGSKNSTAVGAGNDVFWIYEDGDMYNVNGTFSQSSDSKLKENIVDAPSQWSDIKALKVRKFNFKASTGLSTHKQIGMVAQEVETTCPGLITERVDLQKTENSDGTWTETDTGEKTKSIKLTVLYMKAVKALQEAMTRIETLETKVAALESA